MCFEVWSVAVVIRKYQHNDLNWTLIKLIRENREHPEADTWS